MPKQYRIVAVEEGNPQKKYSWVLFDEDGEVIALGSKFFSEKRDARDAVEKTRDNREAQGP